MLLKRLLELKQHFSVRSNAQCLQRSADRISCCMPMAPDAVQRGNRMLTRLPLLTGVRRVYNRNTGFLLLLIKVLYQVRSYLSVKGSSSACACKFVFFLDVIACAPCICGYP